MHQTIITLGTAVLLVAHAWAEAVAPEYCEPTLILKAEGATPYRAWGNRCEGLFSSFAADSGETALDVISVTLDPLSFELSARLQLTVARVDTLKEVLHVRALPVWRETNYQMDARLPVDASLHWPATDVLHQNGFTADLIGVFGFFRTDSQEVFVPVSVRPAGSAAGTGRIAVVLIRPRYLVRKVKWRSFSARGVQCERPGQWMGPLKRVSEPSEAPFAIAAPLEKGQSACLEVDAEREDGKPARRVLRLRR